MKKFAFTALSLVFSAVALAPAAIAQDIRIDETQPQNPVDPNYQSQSSVGARMTTPFQLSSLAYQGYLSDQGIPGYGNLLVNLNTGTINADDVVDAAISAGLIPNTMEDNWSYESALENQLDALASPSD